MPILTDYDRALRLVSLHHGGRSDRTESLLRTIRDSLPTLELANARTERLHAVVWDLVAGYRASFRSGAEMPRGPRGTVDVIFDATLPDEQQDALLLWRAEGDAACDAMRRELNQIVFDMDPAHRAYFTDLKSVICAGRGGEISWYIGMRFMLVHRSNS